MPRYFFDCTQDGVHEPDYDGVELDSFDEAQQQAIETLPAIALETLKRRAAHEFGMIVRDERGPVFMAKLALTTKRLSDSNWV